jgi:hypothetical protein
MNRKQKESDFTKPEIATMLHVLNMKMRSGTCRIQKLNDLMENHKSTRGDFLQKQDLKKEVETLQSAIQKLKEL